MPRPIDRRIRLALHLAADDLPEFAPRWADRISRRAADVLRGVQPVDDVIKAALDLRAAPLLVRGELEARLLAEQEPRGVAAAMGLSAPVVDAYAQLFFDLTGNLTARSWMLHEGIGIKAYCGLTPDDVDVILKLIGFSLGLGGLEPAVRHYRKGLHLVADLDAVPDLDAEEKACARAIRAWVAARTLNDPNAILKLRAAFPETKPEPVFSPGLQHRVTLDMAAQAVARTADIARAAPKALDSPVASPAKAAGKLARRGTAPVTGRRTITKDRRTAVGARLTFKGPAADIAAWEAASRREERQRTAAARRNYIALWAQARAPLGELVRLTSVLQKVILLAAGYHQHARGQWRRRIRSMSAKTPTAMPPARTRPAPAAAHPPVDQTGDLWKRLGELANRAQKGDAAALPEIRRVLDEHPEVWKTAGDWAAHSREAWIKLASHGDAVMAESTRRRLDALQEELSRPFQDKLERLLVERLVICHFQLQLADAELAEVEKQPAAKRGDVLKCHAAAQSAFERAQKALSRHRQLIKAGPSPVDLLRPVAERTPAGRSRPGRRSSPDAGRQCRRSSSNPPTSVPTRVHRRSQVGRAVPT
jgi:hypothetical protein